MKSKNETAISNHTKKLWDGVSFLGSALERAYVDCLFLRPVIADKSLAERMEAEKRARGFYRAGEILYWSFIQRLVKICDDRDSQNRHMSIRKIVDTLTRYEIVRDLENQNIRRMLSRGLEGDETSARDHFYQRLRSITERAERLLDSKLLRAYKTVRDKLIAHTELKHSPEGFERFNIANLRLQFGNECNFLKEVIDMTHELQSLVLGEDFDWNSIRRAYECEACRFWKIESLDENCP